MAVFIAALIVLAKSAQPGLGKPVSGNVPIFAFSNVDFATFYAAAGQPNQGDRNIISTTFEWTNGGHSTTTAPSVFDRTRYRE